MERPGRATLEKVKTLELAKLSVSKSELKAIEQLAPTVKAAKEHPKASEAKESQSAFCQKTQKARLQGSPCY